MLYIKAAIICSITLIFTKTVYANPWVVKEDQIKVVFSALYPDKTTRVAQRISRENFIFYQRSIFALTEIEKEIYNQAKGRDLYNTEKRRLYNIKQEILKLEKLSLESTAFQDQEVGSLTIEYGLGRDLAIGFGAEYKLGGFLTGHKQIDSCSIFLKQAATLSPKWNLAIVPEIILDNNHIDYQCGIHLSYIGARKKYYKLFSTFGAKVRATQDESRHDFFNSLSHTMGMKLPKDVMLLNYQEYFFSNNKNKVYLASLYQQISLAKKLSIGRLKNEDVNIQIGYFWHKSLQNSRFAASGPVISLWLII